MTTGRFPVDCSNLRASPERSSPRNSVSADFVPHAANNHVQTAGFAIEIVSRRIAPVESALAGPAQPCSRSAIGARNPIEAMLD
jgi:hypothetical protein